jgi:hypothetical protein
VVIVKQKVCVRQRVDIVQKRLIVIQDLIKK